MKYRSRRECLYRGKVRPRIVAECSGVKKTLPHARAAGASEEFFRFAHFPLNGGYV
jgi:hypothetical protein